MALSLHTGALTSLSVKSRMVPVEIFMRTSAENARGQAFEAAIGVAAAFADVASTQADAGLKVEWVSVRVAGKSFAGMLAGCPFQVGDEVQVIAEEDQLIAIARPSDRLIGLRPHCVRGCRAYFLRARRRWAVLFLLVCVALGWMALANEMPWDWASGLALGFGALWAFIEYRSFLENARMASRLTEEILSTLGLPQSSGIDLNKTAKSLRRASDPPGYGWNVYRY
jgi:hypothetical protein